MFPIGREVGIDRGHVHQVHNAIGVDVVPVDGVRPRGRHDSVHIGFQRGDDLARALMRIVLNAWEANSPIIPRSVRYVFYSH
jgi:hypothetical protein